jgi:hypothetical protein
MVAQPSVLPKPYIFPIIKILEMAQTKERLLNAHESTPKMGVPTFHLHMSYDLSSQVFPSQHGLPQPVFIYQFKQPFTQKARILDIYVQNPQAVLLLRLANNTPPSQPIFSLMLITLPIKP